MSESGYVTIHGKQYKTVAKRVQEFRESEAYKGYSIQTRLVCNDGEYVVMMAEIANAENIRVASGYAEERRGSTNINRTSALENCETSAIGRALANLGLGGTEYASADEVTDAILQQKVMEHEEKILAHNKTVRENFEAIAEVKDQLADGNVDAAREVLNDLGNDIKMALWVAPTKGGIFTTEEREALKNG